MAGYFRTVLPRQCAEAAKPGVETEAVSVELIDVFKVFCLHLVLREADLERRGDPVVEELEATGQLKAIPGRGHRSDHAGHADRRT